MPAKTDVKFPAFMAPEEIDEVLFTEEMLKKRVLELGQEISAAYKAPAKPLIVICTLKGAATFFADLVRSLCVCFVPHPRARALQRAPCALGGEVPTCTPARATKS
jgi:hypothetical protein